MERSMESSLGILMSAILFSANAMRHWRALKLLSTNMKYVFKEKPNNCCGMGRSKNTNLIKG